MSKQDRKASDEAVLISEASDTDENVSIHTDTDASGTEVSSPSGYESVHSQHTERIRPLINYRPTPAVEGISMSPRAEDMTGLKFLGDDCARKPPGHTGRGGSAFRGLAWVRAVTILKGGGAITRAAWSVNNDSYRAACSIGAVIVRGVEAWFPKTIVSVEIPSLHESFCFRSSSGTQILGNRKCTRALTSISSLNNDCAPISADGSIMSGSFFISDRLFLKLQETVVSFRRRGRPALISFSFSAEDSIVSWAPIGLFLLDDGDREISPYFSQKLLTEECNGGLDLALCILGLQLAEWTGTPAEKFSNPQVFSLVKSCTTPDIAIDIVRLIPGKGIEPTAHLHMSNVVQLLASELDSRSMFNHGGCLKDESTFPILKYITLALEPIAESLCGRVIKDWAGIEAEFPLQEEISRHYRLESVEFSPCVEELLQIYGEPEESFLFQKSLSCAGRVLLTGVRADCILWGPAQELRVPFLSRVMDRLGGQVTFPTGVGWGDCIAVRSFCEVSASEIPSGHVPVITYSHGINVESSAVFSDAMSGLKAALSAGGLLCRGPIRCRVNYISRWIAPVNRVEKTAEKFGGRRGKKSRSETGADRASSILSRPGESMVDYNYEGFPCVVPRDPFDENCLRLCAIANSRLISCCGGMLCDVEKVAAGMYHSSLEIPGRIPNLDICGFPVRYVTGARYIKLVQEGSRGKIIIESSIPLYLPSATNQRRVFCQLLLKSPVVISNDRIKKALNAESLSGTAAVGRLIMRLAEREVKSVKLTHQLRRLSPYEGTRTHVVVRDLIGAATAREPLGGAFRGIDREETLYAEQAYSATEEGLEVAIVTGDVFLESAKHLSREDTSICFRRGTEKSSVAGLSSRTCWVFRIIRGMVVGEPTLRDIQFAGIVSPDAVYDQVANGEFKTGREIRILAKRAIDDWALRRMRALSGSPHAVISVVQVGSNGESQYRLNEVGDFLLTTPRVMLGRLNMALLAGQKNYLDRFPSSKLLSIITAPEAVAALRSSFRSPPSDIEVDESAVMIRGKIMDGYMQLSALEDKMAETRASLRRALSEFPFCGISSILLEYGWTEEILTRMFPPDLYRTRAEVRVLEPIDSKWFLAIGDEAKRLVSLMSDQVVVENGKLVKKVLINPLSHGLHLYWDKLPASEIYSWVIDAQRQVNESCQKAGVAVPKVHTTANNGVTMVTLHHPKVYQVTGVGRDVLSARNAAYRNWVQSDPALSPRDAPKREIKYYLAGEGAEVVPMGDIAFDIECQPGSDEPVTIQMGFKSGVVIWLSEGKTEAPEWLKTIFESSRCRKFGFATSTDIQRLRTLGIFPRGVIDLKEYAQSLSWDWMSLDTFARKLLGIHVPKDPSISVSFKKGMTWKDLTPEMRRYAADDAMLSYEIARHYVLENEKTQLIGNVILYENQSILRIWEEQKLPVISYDEEPWLFKESRQLQVPVAEAHVLLKGKGFIAEVEVVGGDLWTLLYQIRIDDHMVSVLSGSFKGVVISTD